MKAASLLCLEPNWEILYHCHLTTGSHLPTISGTLVPETCGMHLILWTMNPARAQDLTHTLTHMPSQAHTYQLTILGCL